MSSLNSVASAETVYTARAAYWTPENAFRYKQENVPSHIFLEECDKAFDPATGTAEIPLDLAPAFGGQGPASTPNMLARYTRIANGDTMKLQLRSSGETWYVLEGTPVLTKGEDVVMAGTGDVIVLPGGGETTLSANGTDAVLLAITDEPALAHLGAQPPAPGESRIQTTHYPAGEIQRALDAVWQDVADQDNSDRAGKAVLFTSEGVDDTRTTTATIALAINSLEPGGDQTPHRHNAAALTLALSCDDVHSLVDGVQKDWQKNAVMVTPPTSLHSHHNRGKERMVSIVAQDGGLFYNARAVGFSFGE